MEVVGTCAADPTGENKRRVNKKNKNWHKRLHLRKSGGVQPPAMQSGDKNGPKKIAEEWEQTTAWPSSKKPHQEAQPSQCVTNDGGNTLRFTCSQCKDNLEYVPKDLVKHFEEKHTGSSAVFPCCMCTFSTQDFSYFQVHLLNHKDTFSRCAMCGDNTQRTWPEYDAHLTKYHCSNGQYSCEICQKFSTGDVRVFLEHVFGHNLEETNEKHLLKKNKSQLILRCPHCNFESSRKSVITKHVKAVHVCQKGNQQKRRDTIAVKQNDTIPGMNSRLTRSAVKEMCWLTQDCLSLPGREFLDKYCHLSDPQTTLEDTQQFLMNSVATETDDQKWTKALKTVLSNVPQDVNLMENGISSDLAVITVKNKITVGQNGATYAKRLKMTDKKNSRPECGADDAQCAAELKEPTASFQDDGENHDASSVQDKPTQGAGMRENRENQELKPDQEVEDHSKKLEGPAREEGTHAAAAKSTNETEETRRDRSVSPKRRKQQRRRRSRKSKTGKKPRGQHPIKKPLKVKLLFSPSGGRAGLVERIKPNDVHQKSQITGLISNLLHPLKAITSISQSEPGECSEALTGRDPALSTHQEIKANAEKFETRGEMMPANGTIRAKSGEITSGRKTEELQKILCGPDGHDLEDRSQTVNGESDTGGRSSGLLPDAPSQGEMTVKEPSRYTIEATTNKEEAPISSSDHLSSIHLLAGGAIHQESSSPASGHRWHPVPKDQERILKLVAINPSQPVKRPAGDQPVVVLNHPDADLPQVARIMEIINRHKEVRKVVLSRRTMSALSALDSEIESNQAHPSVQERFMLRLTIRRLNKKKYKIVDASSRITNYTSNFPCWFCGRIFQSQETMMAHRQRHLMEWKTAKL